MSSVKISKIAMVEAISQHPAGVGHRITHLKKASVVQLEELVVKYGIDINAFAVERKAGMKLQRIKNKKEKEGIKAGIKALDELISYLGKTGVSDRDSDSDSESELDDDEEAYRHYECAVCERDIEGVGTFNQEVLCSECEEHILQHKKNIKTDEDGKKCKNCDYWDTYDHFAARNDKFEFIMNEFCKKCNNE